MSGLEDKMAGLRARFVADALPRAAELEELVARGELERARQVAHSLAGRSGMFGFGALGAMALAADEAPNADLRDKLVQLAAALRAIGQEG